MSLLREVALTMAIASVLLVTLLVVVVGPERIAGARSRWRPKLRSLWPYLLVAGALLLTRALTQHHLETLAWLFDRDLTTIIFAIEGDLIGYAQAIATPALSSYLGFMYLYGYVVLIIFPAVAYFCLPSTRHLKELLAAYVINDAVGVGFYVTFISFGPRNLGRGLADPILYDIYPQAALLTGSVNLPINAFPSLHASMAATVLLFAWRTRSAYPVWTGVATVYAVSIVFSTMYLGIHWALDAVAGVTLATIAFYGAIYVVKHEARIAAALGRPRSTA